MDGGDRQYYARLTVGLGAERLGRQIDRVALIIGTDRQHNIKVEAMMAKESKAAVEKGKEKRVNPALMRPLQPSKELAAVVGSDPIPRPEVVSKLWAYIKKNNLQNPQNKREIIGDDKLKAVFGKDKVTMFEMNKHVARHLK